jgi:hypothetical protein
MARMERISFCMRPLFFLCLANRAENATDD